MASAPLPIEPGTAARLLAGHIRDTSTVGAVVWHPERPPSARRAGALLLLALAAVVLVGAAAGAL